MAHHPTTFYSASAGSGKTYTLARDYLTLLFKSDFNNGYREILAITFTNKAVAEMKQRILDNLHAFTQQEIPQDLTAIRDHIKAETGLDNTGIRNKATKIEQKLLHDYAAFDIVTIDSFNHRILRTFAREVDLPDGFEIELDSDRLISKAIHNLLARAGKEKQLTDLLVEFSLTKIDDGKSWDIEYDLHNIAGLIRSESHYNYIQQLKDKKIEDFMELRSQLRNLVKSAKNELLKKGKDLLDYYTSNGLTIADFKGKSNGIYNWVKKLSDGIIPPNTQPKYLDNALTGSVAGTTCAGNKATIDSAQSDLIDLIETYKSNVGSIGLYNNALSKLTALSLLNELMHEIDNIKVDEQIVPIYEFNGILSKQITDQPAPFIYERLGEKYRHYFIDEFQDTSKMQWENLMPLIENPLVQLRDDGTKGSLMLVGDAKQSIYRWRGGDADQFLNILNNDQLFLQEKRNETLSINWRSYETIISFNNQLFEQYGNYLTSDVYKSLYLDYLKQKPNSKTGGFVQIDFIDSDEKAPLEIDPELSTVYPVHVKRQIDTAIASGFAPNEICILVRKKKQGDEIARYLVRENMSVVSSDSLLVVASPRVQLLVQFMRMCLFPEQQQPRYEFLLQYAILKKEPHIHAFIKENLQISIGDIVKNLLGNDADVELAFAKAPLFQATEKAAASLGLLEDHDMRLQAFLEHVYEFGTGFEKTASSFLESWENKQASLSVPAAEDPTAIQIMTIHKSKGLEFPVVIVPYCDVPLGEVRDATGWLAVDPNEHSGFDNLYISIKKDCLSYSDAAASLYQEELEKDQMDQINTLYVAFTRAKEQLYISCFENQKAKSNYSEVLMEYVEKQNLSLIENTGFKTAQLGSQDRISIPDDFTASELMEDYFVSERTDRVSIATRKGMLWASNAMEAINAGTQLHDYLSMIIDIDDLEKVQLALSLDRTMSDESADTLLHKINAIIHHPELATYYQKGVDVINERAILTNNGSKAIPDRLVFIDNQVLVIDYKTGNESSNHKSQVNHYAELLISMGHKVHKKILVYTDDLKIVSWS